MIEKFTLEITVDTLETEEKPSVIAKTFCRLQNCSVCEINGVEIYAMKVIGPTHTPEGESK